MLGLAGGNDALLEVTAEDAQAYYERQGGQGHRRGAGPPRAVVGSDRARPGRASGARREAGAGRGARARGPRPRRRVRGRAQDRRLRRGALRGRSRPSPGRWPPCAAWRCACRLGPGARGARPLAASGAAGPLRLEQNWSGFEIDDGAKKYLTVVFKGRSGTFAYDGGVSVTLPLWGVEVQKNSRALRRRGRRPAPALRRAVGRLAARAGRSRRRQAARATWETSSSTDPR